MKWAFLEYDFPQKIRDYLRIIDTETSDYTLTPRGVERSGFGMLGPFASSAIALVRQDWGDEKVTEMMKEVRPDINIGVNTFQNTQGFDQIFFLYAFRFGLHAAVAYTRGMDFKVIAEGRALYLSWKAERLIQSFVGLKGE